MPRERDKPRAFKITAATGVVAIRAAEGNDEAGKPKLRTFSGNAYTGAPMTPEGWWTPIICDLEGIKVPSQHRPALRQHDHEQIVGHTTKVAASLKDGVPIEGVFSGEKQHTDKVTVPADGGFQWQLSIGANPTRTSFLEAGEEAEVNGRTVTGPMTIAHETELGEISFVPLGADGDTSAVVSASKGRGTMFKAMLIAAKKAGNVAAAKFSDDEIDKMDDAKAKAALKECMAADTDSDVDDSSTTDEPAAKAKSATRAAIVASANEGIAEGRKLMAAESQRVADITKRVSKHGVTECEFTVNAAGMPDDDGKKIKANLIAHAQAHGWDAKDAELIAMRSARPGPGVGGPHLHFASAPEIGEAVLEYATLEAANCSLLDSDLMCGDEGEKTKLNARDTRRIKAELAERYPEKVRDHARKLFKGRMGLHQLLTLVARQGGYQGRESITEDNYGQVMSALNRIHADGGSTINVSNLTSNVQNKFLLQGYLNTDQAWREFCAIRSVKDFKPTKSVNLFGDVKFKVLGTSGELDNASLADQAFANQVKTAGRILTIPRSTIINDDLGGFGQVPQIMGRGAGLYLNDIIYTIFLNPGFDEGGTTNFFAATHTLLNGQTGNSNYSSGAGSTLSDAGLTAATLLFDNQIDPTGQVLGVDAKVVLYPPDVHAAARNMLESDRIIMAALGSTASAKQIGANNPWFQIYKPVKARYLNKSAYTGYSTTAWYLLAAPGDGAVIEVAFLNGQEAPTVQAAGPDFQFNILGMTTRAFFDPGVNMQNFRFGVKSNGS